MGKRLLVLHGPNLNLLGEREGREGGRLADLDAALKARAAALGVELTVVQSNHEGVLLDALHAERSRLEGVVVSPAGLFGSYPLRDALEAMGVPAIEVYLEELGERVSVVAEACVATLEGEGVDSYLQALERFASGDLTGSEDEGGEEPVGLAKTLGRRAAGPGARKTLGRKPAAAPAAPPAPVKTLGRKSARPEDSAALSEHVLSRALVRRKIADRLAGRLTPAELAAWARSGWTRVQQGSGPADLEETLQRLTLSHLPATRMSESELVELMTRLDR